MPAAPRITGWQQPTSNTTGYSDFEGSLPMSTNTMTIPQLALQAVAALGIQKPAGFDGTFATFYLLAPQDRIRVTNYSREYVKANPSVFTPETVAVAEQFEAISEDEIDDSIDWGAFWEETAHNAETLVLDPIVNVGQSASLLAKAAPLILLVIGYFILKKKI